MYIWCNIYVLILNYLYWNFFIVKLVIMKGLGLKMVNIGDMVIFCCDVVGDFKLIVMWIFLKVWFFKIYYY